MYVDNRIRGMDFDQYKISIKARPLQMLYTKYKATDTQNSSVRPLGRIRKDRRPSSELGNSKDIPKITRTTEGGGSAKIDMKFNTRIFSERIGYSCAQNNSSMDIRDKENNFPSLTRSKTQAFENKFKIAASRSSVQDSPSPILRPNKSFEKKVVHLPLYKINLRSYSGEEDVSRTVAKTRESLRKLMELNKAKMKNANVVTANIRNYEFSAPKNSTSNSNGESPRTLASQPFPAKPALKSSREVNYRTKQTLLTKQNFRIGSEELKKYVENESETLHEKPSIIRRHTSDIEAEDEPDCSLLSLAIRPDTSLTLGTTMHQIDRVIRSPTSDEMRELSEALKYSETSPAWPSLDDIQTFMGRSHSRTTKSRTPFSRPATVLNEVKEISTEEFSPKLNDKHNFCYMRNEGRSKQKPVLRYTSKQSTYKLDPIIVPSHTCMECPMCNIYQREVETPCPPNTPNTSRFILEPETRPVFIRGLGLNSLNGTHDVLHVARINMNSYVSPEEETSVIAYMKAV